MYMQNFDPNVYPLTCEQVSEFLFWLGMVYGECVSDMKSEVQKRDSYQK